MITLGPDLWLLFATAGPALENPKKSKGSTPLDGIEEYDNPLPRWWFILFIATIVFSAVYLVL